MTDTERLGDATQSEEFQEVQAQVPTRTIVGYRNTVTGREVEADSPDVDIIQAPGGGRRHIRAPRELTPQEQAQAADSINQIFEEVNEFSPALANSLKNNPHLIPYMAELQLSVNYDTARGAAVGPEPSLELVEALIEDPQRPDRLADVQEQFQGDDSLGLFWGEHNSVFSMGERVALLHTLSSVSRDGANRVAARAMRWIDEHGADDPGTLFGNLYLWTYAEQQKELGREGAFGPLAFLVEERKEATREIFAAIDSKLTTPEEAARRADMTEGERLAFVLGIAPSYNAGELDLYNLVSGGADAYGDIVGDPLNLLAGVGLGMKALKGVNIGNKVIKAGKLAAAGRSLKAFVLPRRLSGVAAGVRGGRTARAVYAWSPKTLDTLLDGMVKNGVAGDVRRLVQSGELSQLKRRYPQFARLSETALSAIHHSTTDDDVVDVLRHAAANSLLDDGVDATRAFDEALDAARKQLGDDVGQIDDAAKRIVEAGDDVLYHGTTDKSAQAIEQGGGIIDGGLTSSREKALEWAKDAARRRGGNPVVVATRRSTAPPFVRRHFDAGNDALANYAERFDDPRAIPKLPVLGRYAADEAVSESIGAAQAAKRTAREAEIDVASGILPRAAGGPAMTVRAPSTLDDILARSDELDPDLLKDLLMKAVDVERQTSIGRRTVFTLWDVPRKIAKPKVGLAGKIPGTGRFAQALRRGVARTTGPSVEDEINIFQPNKGADQIRKLLTHYGADKFFVEEMLDNWAKLKTGQRFDWVMDKLLPALGEHINVPVLEYRLKEYFTKRGLRRFASGMDDATDHWVDAAGNHRYDPVIPSQLQAKIPIPVDEINQIVRRYKSASGGRAIRMRGWLPSTKGRRKQIVQRFQRELAERGHLPKDAPLGPDAEDKLYAMAYSWVNRVGDDGRGVIAGQLTPFIGNIWGKFHSTFTKNMLVLRPWQWMLRVAVMEEQLRAYMMNMPSFYRNPVTYMQDAKDAWLLATLKNRRVRNLSYAQDVHDILLAGAKNADQAKASLQKRGLWSVVEDGLGEDEVPNIGKIDGIISEYLHKSVNDHTRLDRLAPAKKASLRVRRDAKKIERAEKILDEMGRPADWDIVDDVPEIQQRLMETYFGRQIGASGVQPRFWNESMAQEDAFEYGYAYGQKVMQYLHDDFARLAFRRHLLQRAGRSTAGNDAQALTQLPDWRKMRDMLSERFGIIDDDVALAQRYLDEVLEPEIRKVIVNPLTAGMDEGTSLRVLRDLEMNRRYKATLGGVDYDIDLTSGNMGAALNSFGDLVDDLRGQSNAIQFPRQIMGNSTDMRFMAADDQRFYTRWSNHIMQFAGEGVTQTLNRRPGYVRSFRRWKEHYTDIGVTDDLATELAHNHAVEAVNYTYFNAQQAPWLVQRLNRVIPFFTATYEVMGTWVWKMPKEVGGSWPFGAGEFARRMQRLIDGLVNIGLVTREEQDDGSVNHNVNLAPDDELYSTEAGAILGGIGAQAIRGLAFLPERLLNLVMENDADGLWDNGVTLSVGHPLNPFDYGLTSFAQAHVGLNPAPNLAVSALAATTGLASDSKRAIIQEGETLADLAIRLDVEPEELARHNRGLITDQDEIGFEGYDALLRGQITADEITLPAGESAYNPGTSMWDAIEEVFMPFGKITDWSDLPMNMLPSIIRWGLLGLGVAQTPIDDFWKGDFDDGLVGALIPDVNQSQMAGQTTEAMMYLEANDVINGKGPWARIEVKKEEIANLLEQDRTEDNRRQINQLEEEVRIMERELLERVRNLTAGSLLTRMMVGQFLPTSPRSLRAEQGLINEFWGSRDYADKLKANEIGINNLQPFGSQEDIEDFFDSVGVWLQDSTGDDMKAKFVNENPALMSYLTPKSFWKGGGTPPQLNTFDEWMDAVIRGDIVQAPLAVFIGRHRSAAIQNDFYTTIQAEFGGETPEETAANALNNWERYQEIIEAKNRSYDALFMEDDFMGGEYEEWINTREETDFALEKYQEIDNSVRDSLGTLLQMEEELDNTYELSEIQNLRSSIRGALAKLSDAIDEWEGLADEDDNFQNPFEMAVAKYWEEVYEPYSEQVGALYDSIDETFDSEQVSLIFEQIKILRNQFANSTFTFDGGSTPMPSPLDIQWKNKSADEQELWIQTRIKNPSQWLDLDAANRILDVAPHLESFIPNTDNEMSIWQQYTLDKIFIDEAYEREELTSGERQKANDRLEEQLRHDLIVQGRADEVEWMDMFPIERLDHAGMLPRSLEYLVPEVRWYKQVLEANEMGPNAAKAREMLDPFYQSIKRDALANPQIRQDLFELGSNLFDSTQDDKLLPQLLFGTFDLQED